MEYLRVGFIADSKSGEYAGYSLRSGFNYSVCDETKENRVNDAKFKMTWEDK